MLITFGFAEVTEGEKVVSQEGTGPRAWEATE